MNYTLGDFQPNLRVNDERTNIQIGGKVGEDSMNFIKFCAIISTGTELQLEKRCVSHHLSVTHYLTT